MTSRVQSENADRSGLLHTMLPNADRPVPQHHYRGERKQQEMVHKINMAAMEEDKIDVVVKIKQKHGINFQIKGEKCLTTSLLLLSSQPRNVLLTVFCLSPYTSVVQVPHLNSFLPR